MLPLSRERLRPGTPWTGSNCTSACPGLCQGGGAKASLFVVLGRLLLPKTLAAKGGAETNGCGKGLREVQLCFAAVEASFPLRCQMKGMKILETDPRADLWQGLFPCCLGQNRRARLPHSAAVLSSPAARLCRVLICCLCDCDAKHRVCPLGTEAWSVQRDPVTSLCCVSRAVRQGLSRVGGNGGGGGGVPLLTAHVSQDQCSFEEKNSRLEEYPGPSFPFTCVVCASRAVLIL